jgi:hypothetical protein
MLEMTTHSKVTKDNPSLRPKEHQKQNLPEEHKLAHAGFLYN